MKKTTKRIGDDDLRPEYDFSALKRGVRGKYFRRYHSGVNLALLEPDVAKAFPTDTAVNEALRKVLRAVKPLRRAGRSPNHRLRTRPTQARKPSR
jgi:hypothetical protein